MWINWRWVSVKSPTGCGMATPEAEVVRWIFSRKLIYLATRWIKKRISPMGTNIRLLNYFSRTSKSPLLPTLSHHGKIQPCWTGNQNFRCDTGNTCSWKCRSSIVAGCRTPTVTSTFSGSSNTVELLILFDVGVTGKSKMAAINRKCICNVLYLSLYMRQQRDSDGYTSTFSGSSNTLRLLWLLSDVGVTGKSNMAAINRKYISNSVYLSFYKR